LERAAFVQLVAEVIDNLPAFFRERLANVAVEVMPLAPPELAQSVGRRPWNLLGLYHGIPYGRRGPWYGNVLPDRVLIFQRPIERYARSEEKIRALVRRVVIHEIGHYFGLSDAELHRLETEADENNAGQD